MTAAQCSRMVALSQGVLDARTMFPESPLDVLYDSDAMPPVLRKAHHALDRAVGSAQEEAETAIAAEGMTDEPKRKSERPGKPLPKIDATPERIARAIFTSAKLTVLTLILAVFPRPYLRMAWLSVRKGAECPSTHETPGCCCRSTKVPCDVMEDPRPTTMPKKNAG